MASGVYNIQKTSPVDWVNDDIRILLVGENYTFDPDQKFVSAVAAQELSGEGYARKTLANRTATQDDANDRGVFDADDPVWSQANFGKVKGGICYRYNADDGAAQLICYNELASPITTNGGDFTLKFNDAGVMEAS